MEAQKEIKKTEKAFVLTTWMLVSILPSLLFAFGAAKLSYDKFGSFGWAILAFLFAPLYYMYYAFFVSMPMPPAAMFAAARRAARM
jgi:hypothetical protein